MLKVSRNNDSSWKALQLTCTYLAMICWGLSLSCFVYGFVFQVICEKTLGNKNFTSNFRDILYENNCNYNSSKFSYKFAFIPFLSSRKNQKQESSFHHVGDLVTRNFLSFVYRKLRSTYLRYAEFNKKTFVKRLL